jgi:hypothetical protein
VIRKKELDVCFREMVVVEERTSCLTETVFSESLDESTLTTVVATSVPLRGFVGTVMAEMDSLRPARMVSIGPWDRLGPVSSSMLLLSELSEDAAELCFLSFLPA